MWNAQKPLSGEKHCRCGVESIRTRHDEQSGRGWPACRMGLSLELVIVPPRQGRRRAVHRACSAALTCGGEPRPAVTSTNYLWSHTLQFDTSGFTLYNV